MCSPKQLLDLITVDGKLYSVPVNIHRSNVLWYNPAVLEEVGIAAPPTTWSSSSRRPRRSRPPARSR